MSLQRTHPANKSSQCVKGGFGRNQSPPHSAAWHQLWPTSTERRPGRRWSGSRWCIHIDRRTYKRQFEFLQSQWMTDGDFISHGTEQDPIIGNNEGDGIYTIPKRPVRRRLHGLPRFVVVRGGEYCFMPGFER